MLFSCIELSVNGEISVRLFKQLLMWLTCTEADRMVQTDTFYKETNQLLEQDPGTFEIGTATYLIK